MHRAICVGAAVVLNKGTFTETEAQGRDRQRLIAEIVALDETVTDTLKRDSTAVARLAAYTVWNKMTERVTQALIERGLKLGEAADSRQPSRPRKHKPKTR